MWKISAFTVMLKDYGSEEVLAILKNAGADGVEWRVREDGHIPPNEIEAQLPEIAEKTEAAGLEIAALATYLPLSEKELIERVLRAAGKIGCPNVRIAVPKYDLHTPYPLLFETARKDLEAIADMALQYHTRANIETHMGNIACSASLAYRLVEALPSEAIGVIFDPGNMVFEGMENWRLGLELLSQYVSHIHVKNAGWYLDETSETATWNAKWASLNGGIVVWPEVLRDLRHTGYTGYLSLEDFYPGQEVAELLTEDILLLHQWIKELSD